MILWLDRETFSELDLEVVGTYQYADSAEDLLISYAIDDAPATVWDCTADPIPTELYAAMKSATVVWAHNAQFDKAVHRGAAQWHLPPIALTRWQCSMALALSHALPAALSELCDVLGVPEHLTKHADGKKLINLFCHPQPDTRKVQRATRLTHPEEWARFKAYAVNDVEAMRECVRRMPRWNWDSTAVAEWHCDQRINERGFYADRELTQAGIRAATAEKLRIGTRFRELTGGVVDRPSQRAQFMDFLNTRFGLHLDNTRGDTFQQELKNPNLDYKCAELMRLSIASNKTSTAKYAALDPAIQADQRFRGGLQFAGAGRTRRWAGRMFQAQNLPSRGLPDADQVDLYIDMLKLNSHDLYFTDLMRFGAAALRGIVTAPPGKKLVVADLANIEGRMLSWVSDEGWKLKAFRAYDAGTGPDLYNITATSIIGGDPWKVDKKSRNVFGKVPDLASGYQGGVAGYQTFAKAYGVRMADHWETIQKMIAPALVEKAKENLQTFGRASQERLEISDTEWIASETCKLAWRARHPATVKFWYDLQNAAKNAINEFGSVHKAGRYVRVKCVNNQGQRWMLVKLPNGRYITYFDPRLIDGSITYMGESAEEGKTTRQWIRVFTHGGKMTGNCLSKETIILTSTGAKPIVQVQPTDLVWDGVSWVATAGVIHQGTQEVGTWLGLKITGSHLIHDGNSWKPVMQLDECSSANALLSALSSVRSPSFVAVPGTAALQHAVVSAARNTTYQSGNFGEDKVCSVEAAQASKCQNPGVEIATSLQTTNCASHGLTGTNTWCADAQSLQTQHTGTMAVEASLFTPSGSPTEDPFSSTQLRCPVGRNSALISIESVTRVTTNPEISDSLIGGSTATTPDARGLFNTQDAQCLSLNFGAHTALNGQAEIPCATTSIKGSQQNRLWKSIPQHEDVFDLVNCGPNSRFTVLTAFGPVLVHNCCQTLARDVLMPALQLAEDRAYLPVLSVHDEVICEVPDTPEYSAQGLIDIMARELPWSKGLPLAAAGFECYRYRKD